MIHDIGVKTGLSKAKNRQKRQCFARFPKSRDRRQKTTATGGREVVLDQLIVRFLELAGGLSA
jgi:hypothetical protein